MAGDATAFARKIERMLEGGADVEAVETFTGNTCLHWAAM
jgi:methionine synthase I (cobalamin-dependent)